MNRYAKETLERYALRSPRGKIGATPPETGNRRAFPRFSPMFLYFHKNLVQKRLEGNLSGFVLFVCFSAFFFLLSFPPPHQSNNAYPASSSCFAGRRYAKFFSKSVSDTESR